MLWLSDVEGFSDSWIVNRWLSGRNSRCTIESHTGHTWPTLCCSFRVNNSPANMVQRHGICGKKQ